MRYSAFISYNHKDRRWAQWLHRALETYSVPARLRGRSAAFGIVGARLPPVFRDREELASSADLAASVRAALAESATLVVVCSPNSARSRWVDEEVRTFIASGRQDRILCVIVAGQPHAQDPADECFPPALLAKAGPEPLAADARPEGDGKGLAKLKLLAGILDVPFDELRQREAQRRQQRLAALAAASLAGVVAMTGLTVFALLSRAEAVEQRDLARQRSLTAKRTTAFVTDLFRASDPSQARGREITVGEVLDTGSRQITNELAGEPAVRADIAATLADVYGTIGDFDRANELARWGLTLVHDDAEVKIRQWSVLARTYVWLGEFDRAVAAAERSVALGQRADGIDPELLPLSFIVLGEARGEAGDLEGAERAFGDALRLIRQRQGASTSDEAVALEGLARLALIDRDFPKAKSYLDQALPIRLRLEGNMSPSVTDNVVALARIALQTGQPGEAERLLRGRLDINRRVLGADHRDVAILTHDLGRALLDQRKFAEALPFLEAAVPTFQKEPDLAANLASAQLSLGIAYRESGMDAKARQMFRAGVEAAEPTGSPILGLLLIEMGDLDCRTGSAAEGRQTLDEAIEITDLAFPDEPWRANWGRLARFACGPASSNPSEAQISRIRRSIDLRWPAGTLYRNLAAERIAEIRENRI